MIIFIDPVSWRPFAERGSSSVFLPSCTYVVWCLFSPPPPRPRVSFEDVPAINKADVHRDVLASSLGTDVEGKAFFRQAFGTATAGRTDGWTFRREAAALSQAEPTLGQPTLALGSCLQAEEAGRWSRGLTQPGGGNFSCSELRRGFCL